VCVRVCVYVCMCVYKRERERERERERKVGEVEGVDGFYLSRSTSEERDLEHI
jgi:hypothetical protein